MNIAFLSSLNPNDQNNWSGTLYSLYTSLQKKHRVIWVGETVFAEVWEFHLFILEILHFICLINT